MPMRDELPPVTAQTYQRLSARETGWARFIAVISNPDLLSVVAFCAIGFLVTINAILLFPDFGAMIAQLAQFP